MALGIPWMDEAWSSTDSLGLYLDSLLFSLVVVWPWPSPSVKWRARASWPSSLGPLGPLSSHCWLHPLLLTLDLLWSLSRLPSLAYLAPHMPASGVPTPLTGHGQSCTLKGTGEAKLQIYWSLSNQGQGMFLGSLHLQTRLGGCGVGVGGGVWRVVGESTTWDTESINKACFLSSGSCPPETIQTWILVCSLNDNSGFCSLRSTILSFHKGIRVVSRPEPRALGWEIAGLGSISRVAIH